MIKYRIRNIVVIVILFLCFTACAKTDKEKLDIFLTSEEYMIRRNTYGGIAGYYEEEFILKYGNHGDLLMLEGEGTDYQSFVRVDEAKKKLLNKFIVESYKVNDTKKELSSSCLTGLDHEYIFKRGFTELRLIPDHKCDSLFEIILYDKH
ncbi:MAG: hypothetical protein ACJ75J_14140 [Cytophagaceae bacterium]